MICNECIAAAPGKYAPGCQECAAREIAGGPHAYLAFERRQPGELEAQMRALWPGADDYRRGRLAVFRYYEQFKGKECAA